LKFVDGFFEYLLIANELRGIFAFQVRKNHSFGAELAELAVLAKLEKTAGLPRSRG